MYAREAEGYDFRDKTKYLGEGAHPMRVSLIVLSMLAMILLLFKQGRLGIVSKLSKSR